MRENVSVDEALQRHGCTDCDDQGAYEVCTITTRGEAVEYRYEPKICHCPAGEALGAELKLRLRRIEQVRKVLRSLG